MHRIHTEILSADERKQIWQDIFQAFEGSGLSQKKFCEKHEIKYDLFGYHLGRHRRAMKMASTPFLPVEMQTLNLSRIHIRWRDLEIDIPMQADLCQILKAIKITGGV